MAQPILERMLDRLYAALLAGPSLNCRPHDSRQRVDLAQLASLGDKDPTEVLRELLGPGAVSELVARVPCPPGAEGGWGRRGNGGELDNGAERTPEERAALEAWRAQKKLLTKLRNLSEDARTYAQDTGVHALMLGYPLLSIAPGALGGGTRRVLAPVAFVPVSSSVRAGSRQGLVLECRGDGVDRVIPNAALVAWLERETGKRLPDELFEDEEGARPWTEVAALLRALGGLLGLGEGAFEGLLPAEGLRAERGPSEESEGAPAEGAPSGDAPPTATEPNAAAGAESTEPDPFALERVPLADDLPQGTALLRSAVLGLFPASNQGLLRDVREMIAEPPGTGPVRAFLQAGSALDADEPEASTGRRLEQERFVSAADPCQARAVRLARTHEGLVVHGPPGTGKSQTITNIIGDHLAAGERVLFVCDKRTALDVVARRLEHLGLGHLCATVHDPQRDQRELYLAIRRALDDLPERKTDARSAGKVAKLDRELSTLQEELGELARALMEPDEHGHSFHQRVGQWMAIQAPSGEHLGLGPVELQALEEHRSAIELALDRAHAIDRPSSPWAVTADERADALDRFLALRGDEPRVRLAACVEDARAVEETASDSIPPFGDSEPLERQVERRAALRDELSWIDAHAVELPHAEHAARLAAEGVARLGQKLREAEDSLAAVRAAALDDELVLAVRGAPPTLLSVKADLAALDELEAARARWYGFLLLGARRRGREVCRRHGAGADESGLRRLRAFLEGLRQRHLAGALHAHLTGAESTGLVADEVLLATAEQYGHLLRALELALGAGDLEQRTRAALVDPRERATLLDGLERSPAHARSLAALERSSASFDLFSPAWRAELQRGLRAGRRPGDLFTRLEERLGDLEPLLRVRAGLRGLPDDLRAAVETLLAEGLPSAPGLALLTRQALGSVLQARLAADPLLVRLDDEQLDQKFRRFGTLEREKRERVRAVVDHLWTTRQKERLLSSTGSRLNALGAALRQRLFVRGRRAMRLRPMLALGREASYEDGLGDPLFDMCPVWLCSPETVAQVFPRRAIFDTLIFDEASQCRLEEALPVLTRAKRVVIAGDPQQLPPTRFFEAAVSDSEAGEIESEDQLFEAQQGEVEDLLAAALNLSIEESYLDVHYRSRNADLIAFSNEHMYGGRLQAIPGHPDRRPPFPPILLRPVAGRYEDRANRPEAEAVVEAVRGLLARPDPPSIGIATFNVAQRDLILDVLEEAALADEDFGQRLALARERSGEGSFEGLFVKNLENVQGDERDVILISTTYGPDAGGRFRRLFGPLGMAGGARRLNVLVTRARQEVWLLSSIPPEVYRRVDPIPEGALPTGTWLLFAYLRHAEELARRYRAAPPAPVAGEEPVVRVLDVPPRSPFAEALAVELARQGLSSDVHWGNEGFCVDLALTRPGDGARVLGVLTDFGRFAGTGDPVEWDLYRCEILRAQGWRLLRVWTPHYVRDPSRLTARVVAAAAPEEARANPA